LALAALISATKEAEDGSGLAATLPVAGRALIERQARLAARAGARHIVLLVERLPAALTAAVDRLRRGGIRVEVARSVADAADHIHPEEHVLLFADGAMAEEPLVLRVAAAQAPALLVGEESAETRHWERLDAAQRWAGLALIDGNTLRHTAVRLGEWDLPATLVRQAVSAGARRLGLADGADTGRVPLAMIVLAQSDAEAVDARMLAPPKQATGGAGWPSHYLFPLLSRALVPWLAVRSVEPMALRLLALLLDIAALPALVFDWWKTALALVIVAAPIEAIGVGLATVRLQSAAVGDRIGVVRQTLLAVAILLLGWRLFHAGGGWGSLLLAGVLVATMIALALARRIATNLDTPVAVWPADADAIAWLLVPAAAADFWATGLGIALAYAYVSLFAIEAMFARRDETSLGRV